MPHIHDYNPTHKHITFIYFATTNTDAFNQQIEHEKSTEIKWFTKKELEENNEVLDNIKFYALKALDELHDKN